MKYIKVLLFSLLLFILNSAQAQVGIKSAPVQKLKTDESVLDKLTLPSGETYVILAKTGNITIDHYNEFMMLVGSNKISMPKFEKGWPSSYRAVMMEDKLVLISISYTPRSQDLVALPIDLKTLNPTADYTLLARIPAYVLSRKFQFSVSPNRKFLGVVAYDFDEASAIKHMSESDKAASSGGQMLLFAAPLAGNYSLILMNSNMEVVKQHRFADCDGSERTTIEQVQVNDDGDFITVNQIDILPDKKFDYFFYASGPDQVKSICYRSFNPYHGKTKTQEALNKLESRKQIKVYHRTNDSQETFKISLAGKSIYTVFLALNADSSFSLAGYYSENPLEYSFDSSQTAGKGETITLHEFIRHIDGAFYLPVISFDKDIQITDWHQLSEPISIAETKLNYMSSKRYDKSVCERRKLVIKEINSDNNGNAFIVSVLEGEQSFPEELGFLTDYLIQFVDEIVITSLQLDDGKFSVHEITCKQIAYQWGAGLLSYSMVCAGGDQRLYFNEFTPDPALVGFGGRFPSLSPAKKLRNANTEGGELNFPNPLFKDYWVYNDAADMNSGCRNILLIYNQSEYRLLRMD